MSRPLRRVLIGALLIGLGLIGLGSLAGGFWIGGQVERLHAEQPSLRLADTTLTVDRFRRGWLHSSATTRVTFPDLPPLLLRQRLIHNPLSGDLLYLNSTPDPDSIWCGPWLTDCAATRLISRLSWRGIQHHALHLPTLTLPHPKLNLNGLSGELQLGLWNRIASELELTIERFTLPEAQLNLERAALHAEVTSTDRQLRLDLDARAAAVRLPGIAPGRFAVTAGAERIDRDTLAELAASTDPASALLAGQRLLRQRPRLEIIALDWQSIHGQLHLNGELTLHAINLLRLLAGAGPLELIETGHGELRIDRLLAERLLAQWSTNQTGPARETAAERLARWQATGFVSLDNNVYHLRFRIDDKGFLLNDTFVPLP